MKLVRSNHTFKLMEELPYFHYGLSVCQLQTQFSQLKMNYLGNLLYLGRQEGSLELESRRDDYLIVWPRNHNALLMGLLRNHVIEKLARVQNVWNYCYIINVSYDGPIFSMWNSAAGNARNKGSTALQGKCLNHVPWTCK